MFDSFRPFQSTLDMDQFESDTRATREEFRGEVNTIDDLPAWLHGESKARKEGAWLYQRCYCPYE